MASLLDIVPLLDPVPEADLSELSSLLYCLSKLLNWIAVGVLIMLFTLDALKPRFSRTDALLDVKLLSNWAFCSVGFC